MSAPLSPSLLPPRGLVSEEEVQAWATFVAGSFAFKKPVPPTRDHFLRHFRNDPYSHDKACIRVIMEDDAQNEIVGSARLVLRPLSTGGWAAGVAEVCVAPRQRGKGLAQRLVQNVLATAASLVSPKPSLSMLHCSPSLVSMYAGMGYVPVSTRWVHVWLKSTLMEQAEGVSVQCLDLDASNSAEVLQEMAVLPSAVVEVIARDVPYFLAWTRNEVMAAPHTDVWGVRAKSGKLLAYCSLRRRVDGSMMLVDMRVSVGEDIVAIIRDVINAVAKSSATSTLDGASSTDEIELCIPAVLVEKDAMTGLCVEEGETDPGWMYKPLADKLTSEEWQTFIARYRAQEGANVAHLVWPIDHF